MTAWVNLNLISLACAIPLIGTFLYFYKSESFSRLSDQIENIVKSKQFFWGLVLFLEILYFLSLKGSASTDEYYFALGLRDQGLYTGHNHFLPHFVASLIYPMMKPFSQETLKLLQCLNLFYALILFVIFNKLLFAVTQDKALAHLGTFLLGASFGIWKYAVSAEVYTLYLTLWVSCLYQAVRIMKGNDSWGQFFFLSLLSNLAVLSYDLAAIMCIPFFLSFLLLGRNRRKVLLIRYVCTGLALFPFFQWFAYFIYDFKSISDAWDFHLYWINRNENAGYDFSIGKNIFIVFREGLYSMFVGIESGWKGYSAAGRAVVLLSHIVFTALLGTLYLKGLHNLIDQFRIRHKIGFPIVLIFGNWVILYLFAILWRPNDEVHHWFLPFTVAGLCFVLGLSRKDFYRHSILMLCLLIPTVLVAASGIYSTSSVKLWSIRHKKGPLLFQHIPDKKKIYFVVHDRFLLTPMKYYRPQVAMTRDVEVLKQAVVDGYEVYIPKIRDEFVKPFSNTRYFLKEWDKSPHYFRVTLNNTAPLNGKSGSTGQTMDEGF